MCHMSNAVQGKKTSDDYTLTKIDKIKTQPKSNWIT